MAYFLTGAHNPDQCRAQAPTADRRRTTESKAHHLRPARSGRLRAFLRSSASSSLASFDRFRASCLSRLQSAVPSAAALVVTIAPTAADHREPHSWTQRRPLLLAGVLVCLLFSFRAAGFGGVDSNRFKTCSTSSSPSRLAAAIRVARRLAVPRSTPSSCWTSLAGNPCEMRATAVTQAPR